MSVLSDRAEIQTSFPSPPPTKCLLAPAPHCFASILALLYPSPMNTIDCQPCAQCCRGPTEIEYMVSFLKLFRILLKRQNTQQMYIHIKWCNSVCFSVSHSYSVFLCLSLFLSLFFFLSLSVSLSSFPSFFLWFPLSIYFLNIEYLQSLHWSIVDSFRKSVSHGPSNLFTTFMYSLRRQFWTPALGNAVCKVPEIQRWIRHSPCPEAAHTLTSGKGWAFKQAIAI